MGHRDAELSAKWWSKELEVSQVDHEADEPIDHAMN